jgi:hypothetical protein
MTPLHIELLLACYVSPDPEVYLGLERWRSSAAVTFLADLQAWGCIDGGTFRVTARGLELVRMLCGTPLPVDIGRPPAHDNASAPRADHPVGPESVPEDDDDEGLLARMDAAEERLAKNDITLADLINAINVSSQARARLAEFSAAARRGTAR